MFSFLWLDAGQDLSMSCPDNLDAMEFWQLRAYAFATTVNVSYADAEAACWADGYHLASVGMPQDLIGITLFAGESTIERRP